MESKELFIKRYNTPREISGDSLDLIKDLECTKNLIKH